MPAQVGAQRQTQRAQTRQDPAPPGPGPAKTSHFFAANQTSIISAHRSDSTLRQVANQPAETVGSATILQEMDLSRLKVETQQAKINAMTIRVGPAAEREALRGTRRD